MLISLCTATNSGQEAIDSYSCVNIPKFHERRELKVEKRGECDPSISHIDITARRTSNHVPSLLFHTDVSGR